MALDHSEFVDRQKRAAEVADDQPDLHVDKIKTDRSVYFVFSLLCVIGLLCAFLSFYLRSDMALVLVLSFCSICIFSVLGFFFQILFFLLKTFLCF